MAESEQLERFGLIFPLDKNLGRKFVLIAQEAGQVFAGVIESVGIVVRPDNDIVYILPVGGRWNISSSFLYMHQYPDYPWFLNYIGEPVSSTARLFLCE